ncbi:MAG: aminoglycoside phosphotransferase, partial [Devosiaceae bacterium]|nr:aminoglycoside phosphotransferase [Devosiaceae bacterium MH13]
WLEAPLDVRIGRIRGRRNDASDANARVAERQEMYDLGEMSWPCVRAGLPLADVVASVRPVVDRLN